MKYQFKQENHKWTQRLPTVELFKRGGNTQVTYN